MSDDLATFLTELDGLDELAGFNGRSMIQNSQKKLSKHKKRIYKALGNDQRGVLSTHPKLKTTLDMDRTQGREAPVNYMPVMGKKPYDRTMYRVETKATQRALKGLTQDEIIQMEREKSRQVLAEDLAKPEIKPKIKCGHTSMQGPERDDHFYTRFLYKKREKFATQRQEKLANQQALEKDLAKKYPKYVIKGGWQTKGTTRDNHYLTKYVYKRDQLPGKRRPSRSKTAMDYTSSQFKFEYLPPYSTMIFDKKRAKTDHGLNQGGALDWNGIIPRKQPGVVHHDLDYDIKHPDPHLPSVTFKSMVGRERRVIHCPVPEFSYTPGEYNVTQSKVASIEGKIKGGKWDDRVPARPKPKTSYTALYGYDRIMKKLKQKKRREKRKNRAASVAATTRRKQTLLR